MSAGAPSRTELLKRSRSIRKLLNLFQVLQEPYIREDHPEWKADSLRTLLAARAELDELIERAARL